MILQPKIQNIKKFKCFIYLSLSSVGFENAAELEVTK
jgi:hypothetical protein